MRYLPVWALAAALIACEAKVDAKAHVEQKAEQKQEAPPKRDDNEYLAKCRKRGEEFFSSMGLTGTPSCYISKDDGAICQLPESSKRKVHVIDCNTDGCNYQSATEY